jgi:AcrR family transcriptional regulator
VEDAREPVVLEPITLSRAAIVRRALAIADRDGLDAVSMRRVGAELGYSGMSLYGHVANKDELLALLVDHVFGTVPEVETGGPWRAAIVEFFLRLREALVRHAAVARIAAERPVPGGHAQRHARGLVDALRRGGLSDQLAVEAFIAMSCYTVGAVMYSAGRTSSGDEAWVRFGSAFADDGTDLDALHHRLVSRADEAQFRGGLEHLLAGYVAGGTLG